jgi:hypothetical protein
LVLVKKFAWSSDWRKYIVKEGRKDSHFYTQKVYFEKTSDAKEEDHRSRTQSQEAVATELLFLGEEVTQRESVKSSNIISRQLLLFQV